MAKLSPIRAGLNSRFGANASEDPFSRNGLDASRPLLRVLILPHRLLRVCPNGNAAHCERLPAVGRPGSYCHWLCAGLRGSYCLPTAPESFPQEEIDSRTAL